ncbi:MAG: hypothetical protein JO152_14815 [Mycobacteriaceae bacterium]|nr:hypothetical protein [Mycobacteriaceae bacterium]
MIVDTGSQDGTQDVIRSQMGDLGIPGELQMASRTWAGSSDHSGFVIRPLKRVVPFFDPLGHFSQTSCFLVVSELRRILLQLVKPFLETIHD